MYIYIIYTCMYVYMYIYMQLILSDLYFYKTLRPRGQVLMMQVLFKYFH